MFASFKKDMPENAKSWVSRHFLGLGTHDDFER